MADEMMEDRVNVEASRSTDELYESSDANHASTQTKEINGNYSMTVAVKEINRSNFFQSWQGILEAIKSSTFLAMDLELSGLGDRKKLVENSIEDRYKAICEVAKTRSVISLGLSCFKETSDLQYAGNGRKTYDVKTYNILLLCNENYIVEPIALRFLVQHGFDFNKQYSLGLPYTRGNDVDCRLASPPSVRRLIEEIISAHKPLVLHNGMLDLVFLYQNFYADLPRSLQTFTSDLSEMFSNGIFDSKYISEYHSREKASFLEYLFRRCQYQNERSANNNKPSVRIESTQFADGENIGDVECRTCLPLNITENIKKQTSQLCHVFAQRGFCQLGPDCPKIHSVQLLLASEIAASERASAKKRKRKKKRKLEQISMDSNVTNNLATDLKVDHTDSSVTNHANNPSTDMKIDHMNDPVMNIEVDMENDKLSLDQGDTEGPDVLENKGHRAGFDAFMTGFIFAIFISNLSKDSTIPGCSHFANKIYLTGKELPWNIARSHFAKVSSQHQEKINRIKERQKIVSSFEGS